MVEEKAKRERTAGYKVIDLNGGEKNVEFASKAEFKNWVEENVPKGLNGITKTGALKTADGSKYFAMYGRAVIPTKAVTIKL